MGSGVRWVRETAPSRPRSSRQELSEEREGEAPPSRRENLGLAMFLPSWIIGTDLSNASAVGLLV